MGRILNHVSSNVGRYSGKLNGAPNYRLRYQSWGAVPRFLYHSGLDDRILYPQIPTRTLGFDLDMLPPVDKAEVKTLDSNLTQQWQAVYADVVVKEIFEGQLTQQKSFFQRMYRFWRTTLGVNQFMMWRPLDLTDKIYRVRIVQMLLDGENFDANYAGVQMPDKWLTKPIEIHFKLIAVVPPSVTIFAAGNLGAVV